jgi:hypothetical protein
MREGCHGARKRQTYGEVDVVGKPSDWHALRADDRAVTLGDCKVLFGVGADVAGQQAVFWLERAFGFQTGTAPASTIAFDA